MGTRHVDLLVRLLERILEAEASVLQLAELLRQRQRPVHHVAHIALVPAVLRGDMLQSRATCGVLRGDGVLKARHLP